MPPPKLRCLIAAGGTAGHVLPALAVAEALTARGAAVTFAGSPDRAEARLVPAAGYEFDAFAVRGFPRKLGVRLARAVGRAAVAPAACVRILRRRRPDVVLGGGGYVAGPMVLAASLLRLPAALTEADAHLGLANRLAAPFARRVFLAFPIDGLEGPKYRAVGRPIPARSRPVERREARRRFDLPEEGEAALVFGGSQGSLALNRAIATAWGERGPLVLHLCGERDYEELRAHVRRDGYRLVAFTDDFGAALGAADLAVARAGGSVWELAAAGVPALLVPYPHATADHQTKNARYFAERGGAEIVPETDLERVPARAEALLADDPERGRMRESMLAAAKPDAADVIAEELIALAAARG